MELVKMLMWQQVTVKKLKLTLSPDDVTFDKQRKIKVLFVNKEKKFPLLQHLCEISPL